MLILFSTCQSEAPWWDHFSFDGKIKIGKQPQPSGKAEWWSGRTSPVFSHAGSKPGKAAIGCQAVLECNMDARGATPLWISFADRDLVIQFTLRSIPQAEEDPEDEEEAGVTTGSADRQSDRMASLRPQSHHYPKRWPWLLPWPAVGETGAQKV